MLLQNKIAIVYGAGGAVGSAVARAFAQEGAHVYLAGRTSASVDALAEEIRRAGGAADSNQLDALDEHAVDQHAGAVAARAGGIDISFNAISTGDNQGTPLAQMGPDELTAPLHRRVITNHLTARAAARYMVPRRSGVILTLTATPAAMAFPLTGSFGVECAAVEGMFRTLAGELGPDGIRAFCIRSPGSPDTAGMDNVFDIHGGRRKLADLTMLRRLPTLAEVAGFAAMLASDRAGSATGAVADFTAGTTVG